VSFKIIGLLGPAGSGKDVVADFFVKQGFVKVAFSDPMKRFSAKVFDLVPDVMWGPSDQRNRMFSVDDEDWCDALARLCEYAPKWIAELEPASYSMQVSAMLHLMDWVQRLHRQHQEQLSARIILQTLGTEWGRAFDPDIWINYTYHTIVPDLRAGDDYSPQKGLLGGLGTSSSSVRGVVINDHRFINEVKATQRRDGLVYKLSRPGRPQNLANPGLQGHASETEQQTMSDDMFDRVLVLPEGLDNVQTYLEALP